MTLQYVILFRSYIATDFPYLQSGKWRARRGDVWSLLSSCVLFMYDIMKYMYFEIVMGNRSDSLLLKTRLKQQPTSSCFPYRRTSIQRRWRKYYQKIIYQDLNTFIVFGGSLALFWQSHSIGIRTRLISAHWWPCVGGTSSSNSKRLSIASGKILPRNCSSHRLKVIATESKSSPSQQGVRRPFPTRVDW